MPTSARTQLTNDVRRMAQFALALVGRRSGGGAGGCDRAWARARLLLLRTAVQADAARRGLSLHDAAARELAPARLWSEAACDDAAHAGEDAQNRLAAEAAAFFAQRPEADPGTLHEVTLALRPGDGEREPLGLRPAPERRRLGAFYTPNRLADHLLASVGPGDRPRRVCDPAAGSGRFLLAAMRAWGRDHRRLAFDGLFGVDLDPIAVELCRLAVWTEAGAPEGLAGVLRRRIVQGDALLAAPRTVTDGDGPPSNARRRAHAWRRSFLHDEAPHPDAAFDWAIAWPEAFGADAGGFDLVLGNPPFLSQLSSRTAASRGLAALLRDATGGGVRGYADIAAAFLLIGLHLVRPGGALAMVQPLSLVAARDAAGVRERALEHADLAHLWIGRGDEFGAGVRACGIVLRRRRVARPAGPIGRSTGLPANRLPPATGPGPAGRASWSPLCAAAWGVPELRLQPAGRLADIATATADFRDEYYGLRGYIVDREDDAGSATRWPRLVTVGLIDPARLRWGGAPTRLLGERWLHPRLDRRAMEATGSLGPWVGARLTPKVLLATQTKVIEAIADADGGLLPTTPVISVAPRDGVDVWRLAAAAASPVAAAEALRRHGGAGMSVGVVKLSARQVLGLPMPIDDAAWDDAAAQFREAQSASGRGDDAAWAGALDRFASAACAAAGLARGDAARLGAWWRRRVFASRPAPVSAAVARA